MALGLFEEAPRFATVWAPRDYRIWAQGPVRYAAVGKGDQVAGYAWVAPEEDATDIVPLPDVDEERFEVVTWWMDRLRQARADRRSPRDVFEYWVAHGADYGLTIGQVEEAGSVAGVYELAGAPPPDPPRDESAGPNGAAPRLFLPMSPRDYDNLENAFRRHFSDPEREAEIERLDQGLAARPLPEDVVVWRNATAESFNLDWRYLIGTVQRDSAYLAVAVTRFDELNSAEVVLHLRAPAGIPAIYLNTLVPSAPVPAPTLLLARGLSVRVHDVRRRGGQWYVQGFILPPGEGGPADGAGGMA